MMSEYSNVLEVERFALHDGPGIRTTVFLQGCPLHCPWCANPESQGIKPLLMHYPKKCFHCGRCVAACPEKVIRFVDNMPVFLRRDCPDCNVCVETCLQSAIKRVGKRMSVDDVMKIVIRDIDYYKASGGGVTFSGGEAAAHPEMLLSLLEACSEKGLHTAVETCGNVPSANLERILPYVDLFLFDIKHLDEVKLKECTGGDLRLILRNLDLIVKSGRCGVTFRIPCIPGFNLDEDFFINLYDLAKESGIRQVDLLPYHTLGKDKYTQLGMKYLYPEKPLDKKDLLGFKQAGESRGLVVTFG